MTEPAAVASAEVEEIAVEFLGWIVDFLEEPDITLEDSFLDVGGTSMLAAELKQKVLDRYGIELDVLLLFEGTLQETVIHLAGERNANAACARGAS